jgi:hypothetical protein
MRIGFTLLALGGVSACSSQGSPRGDVPAETNGSGTDEAWVASACQPASVDTTGWRRYRLGDITIQLPAQYTPTGFAGYDFGARGPGGTVRMQLHREARYAFDRLNIARRGQNWCKGGLGGYQAEVLSWLEPFSGIHRDTNAGELVVAPTYNFVARLPASWGGQDEGKWLFIYVGASRLRDAQLLRDALHTLAPITPDN